MNKHNLRTAIAASAAMLVLILDGKTALSGAAEGIWICLNTLIPSLFPFFLLSILLTGALRGQSIPFLRPVAKICRIPKGAEPLLAIALLGGYPVGAQNVALSYQAGHLTSAQAARMIAFCNNAGPAFIFGILSSMFSIPAAPWLLWAIHIFSALSVGILLPGMEERNAVPLSSRPIRLTDALAKAVHTMALVCGWVVVVRMTLSFLERWILWILPLPLQIAVSGILELSNGCLQLERLHNEGLRFILASGFLALGGICVTLQTCSVTEGISMKLYFPGKLLQCAVSIILSCLVQFIFPSHLRYGSIALLSIFVAILVGFMVALQYYKKSSGIPVSVGV